MLPWCGQWAERHPLDPTSRKKPFHAPIIKSQGLTELTVPDPRLSHNRIFAPQNGVGMSGNSPGGLISVNVYTNEAQCGTDYKPNSAS